MKDDYGYFGKGTTGYVHYMEAFRRNGKRRRKQAARKKRLPLDASNYDSHGIFDSLVIEFI